jgi:hypothetical protein
MKRLLLATLMVGAASCGSPVAPSQEPMAKHEVPVQPPLHHNIRATDDLGRLWFVCATQQRLYCKDGVCQQVEDHYIQEDPCPAAPIK